MYAFARQGKPMRGQLGLRVAAGANTSGAVGHSKRPLASVGL